MRHSDVKRYTFKRKEVGQQEPHNMPKVREAHVQRPEEEVRVLRFRRHGEETRIFLEEIEGQSVM